MVLSTYDFFFDIHYLELFFKLPDAWEVAFFWPHCMACRILVLRPAIEPTAVKATTSPSHWTTREFPTLTFFLNSDWFKDRHVTQVGLRRFNPGTFTGYMGKGQLLRCGGGRFYHSTGDSPAESRAHTPADLRGRERHQATLWVFSAQRKPHLCSFWGRRWFHICVCHLHLKKSYGYSFPHSFQNIYNLNVIKYLMAVSQACITNVHL